MASIYLSSTFRDLQAEREAVYKALRRMRHDVVAMEDYVAADRRPLDKCLNDVRECDVYIGILGWRYGFIPPEADKSITELEFREAQKSGKTCLLFLQDESSRPAGKGGNDRDRVERFREELGRDYLVSFFHSPEDLAAKAVAAVANLFGELSKIIGELDMPLSQVLESVKQLGEMPRLSVRQIEQEVQHLQADAMNWVSQGNGLISAQRRLADARRLITEGIKQAPNNADLLAMLGYIEKTQWQVSERTGDTERANESLALQVRYFRAALEIEPSNTSALNGQVNLYLENGDYERAAALGRLVTTMHPGYTAAFWDLGIALNQKLKRDGLSLTLIEELADVYETLERLIPLEQSGFTPKDLAHAQGAAKYFKGLKAKRSKGKAGKARTRATKRRA